MADAVAEDRVIGEEFKLWKKNIPFMYDFMWNRILEYPSPTVQWFDEVEPIEDDPKESVIQKVLVGTNTNSEDEEDYLMVASVTLPGYLEPPKLERYSMREDAFGSFIYFSDQFEVDFKIPHQGMVSCARYMPAKNHIIASRSPSGIFIYNIQDCFRNYNMADRNEPIYRHNNLQTQTGLEWNPQTEGLLLSGFDSSRAAVWDINSQKKKKTLVPKIRLCHKDEEEKEFFLYDSSWHQKHPEIVGASTSHGQIMLWDIRSKTTDKPSHYFLAHKGSAFQIKFNPFSEYFFISSGSDGQIASWDLRNLKLKLHSIQYKKESFTSLKWSPHYEAVFAATTNDRKIYLFDLDRVFEEQFTPEAEDGPSTLSFVHGGHTGKIYDFDWNPSERDPFMLCSVSDDNIIQIWQPTNKILATETTKNDEITTNI